jgi:hypothetical protein
MAIECPYCKREIEGPDILECPGCDTPHHLECWFENRGCTRYGCPEAPEDEPKMAVPSAGMFNPVQGSTATGQNSASPYRPAKRMIYMTLGLFFGAFGIHNFYAGRMARGVSQLLISCLTLLYASPACVLWALGDVCFVAKDGKGRRMI